MPHIARITVFPIKALDGVSLTEAVVLPSGGLQYDRQWAMFDAEGNFINGKRNPKVHLLRASFHGDLQTVTLQVSGQNHGKHFHLPGECSGMEEWLSSFLGFQVILKQRPDGGFPDDLDSPGPTVISTVTLETVASWYPPLTLGDVRRRFRANLEIGGVEPFWEDRLYGQEGQVVHFQVGEVSFGGVNPCQRCVVPSRNPETAEAIPDFQRTFAHRRRATLPAWATAARFDHYYRLAVNTRLVAGPNARIKIADPVFLPEGGLSENPVPR